MAGQDITKFAIDQLTVVVSIVNDVKEWEAFCQLHSNYVKVLLFSERPNISLLYRYAAFKYKRTVIFAQVALSIIYLLL